MMVDTKQPNQNVISFGAFKAAAQKRSEEQIASAAGQTPPPLHSDKKFVTFDMAEQSAILNLHAEFSIASRDYSYSHGDDHAMIALLACCFTREELVVFTKTLDKDSQAPCYHVSGDTLIDSDHTSIETAIEHARPSLESRAQTTRAKNLATAKRASFKIV